METNTNMYLCMHNWLCEILIRLKIYKKVNIYLLKKNVSKFVRNLKKFPKIFKLWF